MKIIEVLEKACDVVINEIYESTQQIPHGCCYLIGYCLAEGLKQLGYNASSVTGHLILRDKNEKPLVYGTSKHKGFLVGYYHTWCKVNYDDKEFIVDPSIVYNSGYLRLCNIKVHQKTPNRVISENQNNWWANYIPDENLERSSNKNLNLSLIHI